MNDMTSSGKKRATASPLRLLGQRRGVMLVLTMVILLILSSIAVTNLINAYLERSLSQNQHYASISLNAADAAIDYGISWLNANPPSGADWDLPCILNPDVTDSTDQGNALTYSIGTALSNGGAYDVIVSYACDEEDIDGDGVTNERLFFNSNARCGTAGRCCAGDDDCFGFDDSVYYVAGDQTIPVPGGAMPPFPVIEIRSWGSYGDAGRREVSLTLGRNGLDIGVYGAVTGNSNLATGGNITIDGRGHDDNGNLCSAGGSCSCADGYPGITLPCPSGDLNGDGDCADVGIGETGIDSSIHKPDDTYGEGTGDKGFIEDYGTPANSPDEVLGMATGDLDEMIGTPGVDGVKTGTKLWWYNPSADFRLQNEHMDNFATAEDSYGVVIVHNPNFDPYVWNVSRNTGEPGSGYNPGDAKYDPLLDAASPGDAYYDNLAPRKLDLNSNTTFKGVIIADAIDKVNGNADVIGAVVSLSSIKFGTLGNGSARILFSCDAIQTYTTQGFSTKLSWHRRF